MVWQQGQIRLFRALLHCYPAEFRHEYGAEMEQLFADRLRAEPRIRLWLETLADIALSAPKEHAHILAADLRYGVRILAAAPAFTLVALVVMALGIGSTTAIFSLVDAVLLRSLPYGHAGELYYLWSPNVRFAGVPQELGPNVPDFYEWQRQSKSFSSIALLRQGPQNLIQDGAATRIEGALVGGNFFTTMQAAPALGRAIEAHDDQPGHEHVAVISDRLWRTRFASDPHILGRQIQINREHDTIVGVMPKDFGYPFEGDIPYGNSAFKQTDLWLPAAHTAAQKSDRVNFESTDAAIGRLRPGVSPAAAQSELVAIESRLGPLYPEMWRGWTALVRPLVETIVGPVEKMMWLLLGAVCVVLLIAISNVANLLFARATARAHEMGIRTALGAERGRIIRQLLTESLLLSCTGGALGIGLAYAAVHLLVRLNPGDVPRFDTAAVDGRVLLVAVVLSIAAGLVAGLAPAISTSRAGIYNLLKQGSSRGASGSSNRGRFALIVAEVALSVILLAGAGLLVRSYLQLQAVEPGFSPATLTFGIHLDDQYRKPELRASFHKTFLQKLASVHGVKYSGASSAIPLNHQDSVSAVEIRGLGKTKQMIEERQITAGYLQALGTPLLLGRNANVQDPASKAPVVMVNRAFVDAYLRGRDPLGAQLRMGIGDMSATPWSTVVGIVADIRDDKLEAQARPEIFQAADNGENYALQTDGPVQPVIDEARAILRSMDPALTVDNIQTMRERMQASNARRRFQTMLLTGFSAIAIALALVGLYGLMSYSVKERTAEIGLRLALGSSRSGVVRMILSQGMRLTVAGLVLGLVGAFALTRLVSAWLFGVQATDPVTFTAVPLFVLVVAACACLIPAFSATRIDPVQALRQE